MNLQSILKPGKKVELNITDKNGELHKLNTRIERGFNGESLDIISPIDHGKIYALHENEVVVMIFDALSSRTSRKKDVYKMEIGVLSRTMSENQLVLTMKKISGPQKIQRRETFRLSLLKSIPYRYNGHERAILLKNISATGLRGILEERVPKGESLTVHLDLEDGEPPLEIDAEVISCDPVAGSMLQYDIRLHFSEIAASQRNLISRFILHKQSEAIQRTRSADEIRTSPDMHYGYRNNKRRGDDLITQAVPIMGLVTWFISLSILALIVEARPEIRYNLDQFFNFYKRNYWDANLLRYAFVLAVVEALICSVGLYMNSKRMKRAEDQYNRGLIFNLLFSVLFICLYVLFPLSQ